VSISRLRTPAVQLLADALFVAGEEPARLARGRHRVVGGGEGDVVQRAVAQLAVAVTGADLLRALGLAGAAADQEAHRQRKHHQRSGHGTGPNMPTAMLAMQSGVDRRARRRRQQAHQLGHADVDQADPGREHDYPHHGVARGDDQPAHGDEREGPRYAKQAPFRRGAQAFPQLAGGGPQLDRA